MPSGHAIGCPFSDRTLIIDDQSDCGFVSAVFKLADPEADSSSNAQCRLRAAFHRAGTRRGTLIKVARRGGASTEAVKTCLKTVGGAAGP
jgi:hypothetical protein